MIISLEHSEINIDIQDKIKHEKDTFFNKKGMKSKFLSELTRRKRASIHTQRPEEKIKGIYLSRIH